MIKMRKMISKDRESLYEMLQKSGVYSYHAIALAMDQLDSFLFDKEQKEFAVSVAEDGQKDLAGFICYRATPGTEGTFDISWLVVSPHWQQSGIEKVMLDHAEQQIIRLKGRMILVEISSATPHQSLVAFYQGNGFASLGKVKDFYRKGEDLLFLSKKIQIKRPDDGSQPA
jgi:ribosomal protein S18 acetylase RimI-like enzyme